MLTHLFFPLPFLPPPPRASRHAHPLSRISLPPLPPPLRASRHAHSLFSFSFSLPPLPSPPQGITACDEGPGTIGDRFAKYGIANSEEARRAYRQMLFEAPTANSYLCAAILDPETLYQRSSSAGQPLFPDRLKALGILPGVKPHLKVYALPGQNGATVMQVRTEGRAGQGRAGQGGAEVTRAGRGRAPS